MRVRLNARPDNSLYFKMLKRLSLISTLSGLIALSSTAHAATSRLALFDEETTPDWSLSASNSSVSGLNLSLPIQHSQLGNHKHHIYTLSGDTDTMPPTTGDRAGLIKDTKYFFAYQAAIVGLLYFSPQSFSGWSDEQKDEFSFDKYRNNIRHAVWDTDQWEINYFLHPYWGSAYYVRARERGFDENTAFWYSAALSASFEFGFEAFFEEPSLQDIIVTPVAGSFLGMYFMKLRKEIRNRHAGGGEKHWSDSWIMGLTDPLGTMNAKTDQWFSDDESSAQLSPVIALPAYRSSELDSSLNNRYRLAQVPALGMQYSYRW